jgi:hypothetical protein
MSETCPQCGWNEYAGVAHDCSSALHQQIEELRQELAAARGALADAYVALGVHSGQRSTPLSNVEKQAIRRALLASYSLVKAARAAGGGK